MNKIHTNDLNKEMKKELSIDCNKCSGLCCTALFFSKMDGFPENKSAGRPCRNLLPDFCCKIHSDLVEKNMKGCLAYDCFGAGQKVTKEIYSGENWKENPSIKTQIFEVFFIVYQLHQMMWYLMEASNIIAAEQFLDEINLLISKSQSFTQKSPEEILKIDLETHRLNVNQVLKKISGLVSAQWNPNLQKNRTVDYMGKNFKSADLDGQDFSMTLLIAANLEGCSLCGTNFLGADMRDVNIKNTDLSESIFLTQGQVNSAKGSSTTKLPAALNHPFSWV